MFANERRRAIHLDHGEAPARGRDGVTFFCVRLLANPQRVQLGLKGVPIDYSGGSKGVIVGHRLPPFAYA
jgi:hypothetical protein